MQRTGADIRHGGDCDANYILCMISRGDGCMLHLCFRWLVFVGALPVFRHAQFRLGMSACFMCSMCLGG